MDGVTRFWTEFVASIADLVPGGVVGLALLLLLLTTIVSLLWYFWPAWLPGNWNIGGRRGGGRRRDGRRGGRQWRWSGLGKLRFRWRLRWPWRRRRKPEDQLLDLPPDQVPDLPSGLLVLTADQLASEGRFAE